MHFPLATLIQGIIIGLAISIPLGPVGLIVMKRTIDFGLRAGIFSSLAVIVVDTAAIIFILLGLHKSLPILHFVPRWAFFVGAIGFFLYGAYIAFMPTKAVHEKSIPWHRHFGSAVLLTITNPSTYLSFAVIGLMVSRFTKESLIARMEITAGFFIGCVVWWAVLVMVAFSQRKRYAGSQNLQRTIGIIIMVLAIGTCFSTNQGLRHLVQVIM